MKGLRNKQNSILFVQRLKGLLLHIKSNDFFEPLRIDLVLNIRKK